ncbi:40S ribosomal protein S29 [Balamuthia mandrillaris]
MVSSLSSVLALVRFSRACGNRHGLIRKYDLNMCRQCFRTFANDIGFHKVPFSSRFLFPYSLSEKSYQSLSF